MELLNRQAVENFCEYLRIETVHPNPDYGRAVEFIKKQSEQLQLDFQVVELVPNNPVVILKWSGLDQKLKSVVLNSHMDVVPVFPEQWKYHPFSAHIDENGNIYARGTQDMKSLGIQYLEAIRRIKTIEPTFIPKRNVFVLFVPDEEAGGKNGMREFVETEMFKNMNIGVMMDESYTSEVDEYNASYAEKICCFLKVFISGSAGHGAQFVKNSAGVKMSQILEKFMKLRNIEETKFLEGGLTMGDVISINLTGATGGVQYNVVPSSFSLDLDIRAPPTTDLLELQQMFDRWGDECGGGIEFKFMQSEPKAYVTGTDSSNPWWTCFAAVCKSMDMKINPQILPGTTDSRFIRMKGISAIGFTPINNTPILLHNHNEFLNTKSFIYGIHFYERLIPALASVVEM